MLPPATSYTFRVVIKSWLGSSSIVYVIVNKNAAAAPQVSIVGDLTLSIERTSEVTVGSAIAPDPCAGTTVITHRWSQTSGPSYPLSSQTASQVFLFIPRNSLVPGQGYDFQVAVTSSAPLDAKSAKTGYASVRIDCAPIPAPVIINAVLTTLYHDGARASAHT